MGRSKSFFLSLIALVALAISAPATLALANPGTIRAIAVDPLATNTVYVATQEAGVLKTTDNGATWAAKNAGLPTRIIADIAVDPLVPANVYIATARGAFRSTDGGDSWELTKPDLVCTALAVDSAAPGNVFMGTATAGLLGSADYGQTWVSLGGQDAGQITGLAIGASSVNPNLNTSDAVFKPETVYMVSSRGEVLVGKRTAAGLYEFVEANISNQYVYSLLGPKIANGITGEVWVGVHEGGIYMLPIKEDAEWIKVATPNGNANINGLARDPQSENRGTSYSPSASAEKVIYAASFDGYVMKGVGDGASFTWNNILDAGILGVGEVHPRVVTTVALIGEGGAVQTPPPLWVGTFSANGQSGAVYYSPDGGATWTNALAGGWTE